MLREVLFTSVIVLVYACFFIIVFAPSIYAFWFYIVARKISKRSRGLLRVAIITLSLNAVIAYFLCHLAFNYFVPARLADNDAMLEKTVRDALVIQERFFAAHGRYYALGPVRGPYQDENGLYVDKDVVLEVVPVWDRIRGRETFLASAVHVWGNGLVMIRGDGKVVRGEPGSDDSSRLRRKLLNSVK